MSAGSWAVLALVVYVAGLVLAFGLRTFVHWRATGSTGFRGISGRPGSVAWWGGVLFPVALVLGLVAPVLALTGATPPVGVLPAPVLAVAGLVVGVAGVVLVLAAQAAMGASWRIGVDEGERTELVTGGLFGRVRNPIFTGMVAVSVGVLLMAPTIVAALATVCLVAAVQMQVRAVEEPYLRRAHGRAYEVYLAGSGRFLPKLPRVGGTRPPGRPRRGETGPEEAVTGSR